MKHDAAQIAALVIFALTYLAIAWGRFPGLRLDRTGAALAGATCMIASGVLTLRQAYAAIDFDTVTLLLGVMIVVATLRLSGLFSMISTAVARHARRPLLLLVWIVLVSGILSAFLVNDTICLALTPLVLEIVVALRRNPLPYLLAVAMASNAGSVATITGNPQNMIVGSLAHIPYAVFAGTLAPVAAASLLLSIAVIAIAFPAEFRTAEVLQAAPPVGAPRASRALIVKAAVITAGMVGAFFWGFPPAAVAISAGVLMLLTRRLKPERIYAELDWPLLLMFVGLFIVVAGLESVLTRQAHALAGALHLEHAPVLVGFTAVLSNIVSNVPAVLVLRPFLGALPHPQHAWLLVAMSSTLAGNFTLVGSVANLIVARRAQALGTSIGFWAYFRVGAPLTILTLLIGTAWLAVID
ncbi:MAG TPA: anion transporter [Steroidobacteraceae bacterium]|nr:anion transporter [Steroidobacteraceae bacterium]